MPPFYRSNPGGLYNSGVFPDSRPRVDVGSILDAMSSGVQGIIQSNLQRKMAERNMAMQQTELDLRRQAAQREQEQQAFEREYKNKDLALRTEESRRKFMTEGGVPAHDETQPTVEAVPTTATIAAPKPVQSPIARAMTPAQLQPQITPTSDQVPPSTMTVPTFQPQAGQKTVHRDESYDPTRAAAYIRSTEVARLHDQGLMTRAEFTRESQQQHDQRMIDARSSAAAVAQAGREKLVKLRQAAATSGPARPMTATAQMNQARTTASGIIAQFNGSYDDAAAWLKSDDPEAKALSGTSLPGGYSWSRLLQDAHAKYAEGDTKAALSLEKGATGAEPGEAVSTVAATRTAVRSRLKKAGTAAPAASATPAPKAATGTAQPSGGAAAPSKTPPPQSQDEYDFLLSSGMTDAQIVARYGQPAAGIKRKK